LTITPYCVVRSRNVTMADAEPTPMIMSPSQWPASSLVSVEAGRWSIMVLLAIVGPCPVWVSHRDLRIPAAGAQLQAVPVVQGRVVPQQ
jgi:hypothetical protein